MRRNDVLRVEAGWSERMVLSPRVVGLHQVSSRSDSTRIAARLTESVFRSLKSELGLRPVYHWKQNRSDGHLFISVLAYQLVQVIRSRLRAHGETASWRTLRDILSGQIRVTACFRRADRRVIHIRKATRAEPRQREIYRALGLDPEPGKTRRMVA